MRPTYIWNRTQALSDMLGTVSAALASAAVLVRPANASEADRFVAHAEALYAWGAAKKGGWAEAALGRADEFQKSLRWLKRCCLGSALGSAGRQEGALREHCSAATSPLPPPLVLPSACCR